MASNMYPNVVTIDPLLGSCEADCLYCDRNKRRYHGMPRLDPNFNWGRALGGKAKTILVCFMTDLFAPRVSRTIQDEIVSRCFAYPQNTYLWQTKYPDGYGYPTHFPDESIFAVTIETDRYTGEISCAPTTLERVNAMRDHKKKIEYCKNSRDKLNVKWNSVRTMVSVEPIMDFDDYFIEWIDELRPDIVSIGADTGHNNLPEPSEAKLKEFVGALRKFVPDVRIEKSLRRLWPDVEVT